RARRGGSPRSGCGRARDRIRWCRRGCGGGVGGRCDVHVHVPAVAADAGGQPRLVVVVDEHVPVAQGGDGHLDAVADDGVVGVVDGTPVAVAVVVGRDAQQVGNVVAVVVEGQRRGAQVHTERGPGAAGAVHVGEQVVDARAVEVDRDVVAFGEVDGGAAAGEEVAVVPLVGADDDPPGFATVEVVRVGGEVVADLVDQCRVLVAVACMFKLVQYVVAGGGVDAVEFG